MRITNLEVENFRGIRECRIVFPLNSRILCLIGAGDSTKSTVLKAIEWVFWPTWSLVATDSDFYRGDISSPIVIRCTFAEFPNKLLAEDRFGLYLRKPGVAFDGSSNDEPTDDLPVCLTIQLTIDASLEPKWEIVCNRQEPRIISHNDRKLFSVGVIGGNASKDLIWGKYSVLQKYADAKGVLHDAYTSAVREAAKNADLKALDSVATTLTDIGKKYGVEFESEIRSRLIVQGSTFSSTVGLFDGDAPLSQFGTGSQRLLSMGLNIGAAPGEALLLIDEVENGLEPYRLRNLINEFRAEHSAAGQIIMTTHSPITVAECSLEELMIVHCSNGKTEALAINSDDKDANTAIQRQIRGNSEAFLSKRLIVCEGKTEIGFVRALDSFIAKTKKVRMAYKGVGIADGGGSSIFCCAAALRKCGYEICILMDSDKDSEDVKKQQMRMEGISVFDWDKPNALEEQFFTELPLSGIQEALQIVVDDKGIDSIKSSLSAGGIPFTQKDGTIVLSRLTEEQKKTLGTIAKDGERENGWYKRIGLGQQLGKVVFEHWDELDDKSAIKREVDLLIKWVMTDDSAGT